MTTETDLAALCHEFTVALTEVLAENAASPARRGRVARAHAAVKRHPEYNEHAFCVAVETAFTRWERTKRRLLGRVNWLVHATVVRLAEKLKDILASL